MKKTISKRKCECGNVLELQAEQLADNMSSFTVLGSYNGLDKWNWAGCVQCKKAFSFTRAINKWLKSHHAIFRESA